MNVILHVIRYIVLNDHLQLFDVQSSSGDRSRNHDRTRTILEVDDRLISVDLLSTSVERHASVILVLQFDEEFVGTLLSFDEDEGSGVLLFVEELSEEFEHTVELGFFWTDLDELGNRIGDD